MKLEAFAKSAAIFDQTEVEKVRLIAYFQHKAAGMREFCLEDIRSWFENLHLHAPNTSRLKERLEKSKSFVRGSSPGSWKLHAIDLDELQGIFPGITSHSEEIESTDCILPRSLYENTRGFIELLSRQINASYEYNIFDGCAVLMRRLVEVLLILSYEHNQIDSEIQDGNGQYLPLEKIIANAKNHTTLRLARDTKVMLDELRSIGNFAAHKIYFNCRRPDLQRVISNYRATVEELLYKSGIRK